ncbi:MAG: hypothetical protein ACM3JI_04980, partial [Anaerolineae bacterium]
DKRTTFLTKNYGAHDKSVPDERGNKRFRLQGLFETRSRNDKLHVNLTYDRLSDNKMPGDFKSDDFEINTQKRTKLLIDYHGRNRFATFTLQPRINPFQSLNQELPSLVAGIRPFELGTTGIISENRINGGFLDYVYVDELHKEIPNMHALRFEMQNALYRPIPMRYLTFTPHIGFSGIFYNNSQEHRPVYQAIFTYGAEASMRLYRTFDTYKHLLQPYLNFQGYTPPTIRTDKHFYFNIDDGYAKLNLLRAGLRQSLFSFEHSFFDPVFDVDLYTYGFFGESKVHRTFPKAYATFNWRLSSFTLFTGFAWNMWEQLVDYSNIRALWTVNENLAFTVEMRHRSKFDWRKADHENYFVDAARPIDELLHSPLSDGRNTLLTRFRIRLTPKTAATLQSHHGWGRKNEPAYNSYKVELFSMLTCSWQLKLSLERTPNDVRFSQAISLVK